MKKVCKIVLIFLIILNLYSTVFNVKAAGPGGGANSGGGGRGFGSGSSGTGSGGGANGGIGGYISEIIDPDMDIWGTGQDFLDIGSTGYSDFDSSLTRAAFKKAIDFLWGLGLLVVFASTVILGIKYMLVNPNEKSRIKQATTPYIIGVVVIFGALTIWKLLIEIFEGSII